MMEDRNIIYKVSELNLEIKNLLGRGFSSVWVEGEISGVKRSSLGHIYFDLKDENSIISAVIFKWSLKNIDFEPENGVLVKVLGDVTIYDKQSKYQIVIKKALSLKYGPLQLRFEELKKKLMAEGLFDDERKKKIPAFPQNVAVITSLYGAAIRDIISIIKRRAKNINIFIFPVRVQGDGASDDIAMALKEANKKKYCIDVIILGRGGGSMEDLWAFNEEAVARAIAASGVPVISSVGHQTDFTISDFVADLRAATPSAAAEIITQGVIDTKNRISQIEKRLISSLKIIYQRIKLRFFKFINSNFYKNPFSIIEKNVMEFDNLYTSLNRAFDSRIKDLQSNLKNLSDRLKNLNPETPMKKGYTITKKGDTVIRTIDDITIGDVIEVIFSDGSAKSNVFEKIKKSEHEEAK
jgi:exodeoxyribonuclease VII large subunit